MLVVIYNYLFNLISYNRVNHDSSKKRIFNFKKVKNTHLFEFNFLLFSLLIKRPYIRIQSCSKPEKKETIKFFIRD